MDPALKTLKAALEAIRDTTMNALAQIGQSQEEYSMRWQCKECRLPDEVCHNDTPDVTILQGYLVER